MEGLLPFIAVLLVVATIAVWKYGVMGLVQTAIVLSVIFSNIYWHWTPSGLVAGLAGMGAAWLLTIFPLWLRYRLFHRPPGTPFLDLSVSRFPREEPPQEDIIGDSIPPPGDRSLRIPPGKRDTLRPPR